MKVNTKLKDKMFESNLIDRSAKGDALGAEAVRECQNSSSRGRE